MTPKEQLRQHVLGKLDFYFSQNRKAAVATVLTWTLVTTLIGSAQIGPASALCLGLGLGLLANLLFMDPATLYCVLANDRTHYKTLQEHQIDELDENEAREILNILSS